jgi:hypothetical protein
MKGKPKSNYQSQKDNYVSVKKDGQYKDVNGNSVKKQSDSSHIPVKKFDFDKIWKK